MLKNLQKCLKTCKNYQKHATKTWKYIKKHVQNQKKVHHYKHYHWWHQHCQQFFSYLLRDEQPWKADNYTTWAMSSGHAKENIASAATIDFSFRTLTSIHGVWQDLDLPPPAFFVPAPLSNVWGRLEWRSLNKRQHGRAKLCNRFWFSQCFFVIFCHAFSI